MVITERRGRRRRSPTSLDVSAQPSAAGFRGASGLGRSVEEVVLQSIGMDAQRDSTNVASGRGRRWSSRGPDHD